MVGGSCYCGGVQIEIPRKPKHLTDCNCSICRKYGALWAYFLKGAIRIRARKGSSLVFYNERTRGRLRIGTCSTCGCVTHYDWGKKQRRDSMMAINGRLLDLDLLEKIPVRKLDGARHWKVVNTGPTYPFAASKTKTKN